jgi:putative ABC transport system permease protein
MTFLPQELKHALRRLAKSPGFALIAVATIAIVLGVNTAIFGLLDALLLRPLPYKDPQRLVHVWESIRKTDRGAVAYLNFEDLSRESHSFSSLAAWGDIEADVSGSSNAERILGEIVTAGYFSTLGLHPSVGRDFTNDDDLGHPAVILSHGLWQSRFGSDPDVIGRTLNLSGSSFTVIGVMPAGFRGYSGTAAFWVPIVTHPLIYPAVAKFDFVHTRDIHWVHVLARLRDGVTPASAAAEIQAIGDRLAQAYPNDNRDRSFAMAPAQQDWARHLKPAILALLVAVTLVLLVACANLTNLFLVRLARRERELAVRLALGATQSNLFKLLLYETTAIAVLGALGALGLFAATKDVLLYAIPMELPSFAALRLDSHVLLFTGATLLLTIISITLLPAWQLSGRSPLQALTAAGSRSETGDRRRTRNLIAAAEIAFSVLLTIGAGLLIKSLWRLQNVDPGFQPDNLVTLRFDLPNRGYSDTSRLAVGEQIAESAKTMPGIESAAVTAIDPFVWPGLNRSFTPENHANVGSPQNFYEDEITPGYFHTMGIPLVSGRDFTANDNEKSPATVIVSQSFAQRFWPGENALGKHVRLGGETSTNPWATIIGIAGNAQIEDLHTDKSELAILYVPLRRSDAIISLSLVVRSKTNAADTLSAMRAMLQRFDPNIPVYSESTLRARLAGEAASARSYAILMVAFGSIAISLALMGVYGVFAYSVAQRTREIGIRVALGAQRSAVLGMISAQALRIALAGAAAGVLGAVAFTRLMKSVLFEVSAYDPIVFIGATSLLIAATLAAGFLPARRAATIDPVEALRDE